MSEKFSQNSYTKEMRLISKSDFANLRNNSSLEASGVLLSFYKDNSHQHSRLGLAISKKFGNAVFRNKAKRILREHFRKSKVNQSCKDILICLNQRYISKNNISKSEIISQISDSYKDFKFE